MEHFAVVEKLCRGALVHSGGAPEVRRLVAQLRNALSRQAHGGAGEAKERAAGAPASHPDTRELGAQAAALARLLERQRAAGPAPERGVAPTAETRARLAQDTVRHMLRRGTLAREHADAADEIRDVFEALTAGLFARARQLDVGRAITGAERRAFRQPLERLPERLHGLWRRRYKPWADAAGAIRVARSNIVGYSALELTIDVLVDGRSLAEIDRGLGLRRGTAAAHFRAALERYAVIAGWLRPPPEDGATTQRGAPPGPSLDESALDSPG